MIIEPKISTSFTSTSANPHPPPTSSPQMGRYNFAPARVHQATTDLLTCGRIQRPPPWYNVIGSVPPPEILVRTPPVQQHSSPPSDQLSRKLQRRKPSKLFKPQRIDYPEDALRREFFKDHPWELARPRLVVESDGCDARRVDWSSIRQSGRPLDGERCVFFFFPAFEFLAFPLLFWLAPSTPSNPLLPFPSSPILHNLFDRLD